MIKMKEIPLTERPRERLINGEVSKLSNEDLLAIILSSGTREHSVKSLAQILLKELGDIKKLTEIDYNFLVKIKGIGKAKACNLLASIELSNRINRIGSINNLKFKSPRVIYEYFSKKLRNTKQEHFYCLYLDSNFKIIKEKLLFIGTINQSLVHPREIYKEAYLLSSSYIICIHNHPSGNVKPSNNDINLTNKLIEASKILGIRLIDHIIVSKDDYYSFLENDQI